MMHYRWQSEKWNCYMRLSGDDSIAIFYWQHFLAAPTFFLSERVRCVLMQRPVAFFSSSFFVCQVKLPFQSHLAILTMVSSLCHCFHPFSFFLSLSLDPVTGDEIRSLDVHFTQAGRKKVKKKARGEKKGSRNSAKYAEQLLALSRCRRLAVEQFDRFTFEEDR